MHALDAGDRRSLSAYLAEIDWASARGIDAGTYPSAARRTQRHPAPGIESCAKAYTDFQILKRRRGVIDFDDVLAHTIRDLRRDNEFADGEVALPAPPRRRSAGPQPAPTRDR